MLSASQCYILFMCYSKACWNLLIMAKLTKRNFHINFNRSLKTLFTQKLTFVGTYLTRFTVIMFVIGVLHLQFVHMFDTSTVYVILPVTSYHH